MVRVVFFSLFVSSLQFPILSLASAPGSLNFFLDYYCTEPSIINPTVDLPVDTCIVTPGAYGVAVKVLPPCTTGSASVLMYLDTSCANAKTQDVSYDDDENCYSNDIGGSVPTATTTVTFGSSSLPVAGGAATTNAQGGTPATSPSSNNASPTRDSGPSTSSQSGNDKGSNNSGGSGGGLSRNAQIAIGVGIPAAALIVAVLAWQCPKSR